MLSLNRPLFQISSLFFGGGGGVSKKHRDIGMIDYFVGH